MNRFAPRTRTNRFALSIRILHWLLAVLVIVALLIGFAMVASLADYRILLSWHRPLGALILLLAIIRLVNRIVRRTPASPLGGIERVLATGSEILLYALLLAQPLVGWAMVSASGVPVVMAGSFHLPAIAPVDPGLYAGLRSTHTVLAYSLVAVFTAHMLAVLVHALVLRDGVLRRMTFGRQRTASTDGNIGEQ